MRHIGVSVRHAIAALTLIAACSVEPVTFTPVDDAGTDATPDTPDVVALMVSTSALTIDEAATGSFTIQLTAPPASPVLVSIDSADDNRVGVAPTSVQFDNTNWNVARSVTVSGQEDADTENEVVDIDVSSSVGDATVTVTVADDDSLRIVVSPSTGLDVTEGSTASLAVHLSAQPSGPVTVMVASSDAAVAGVSPTMLTFGTGTWDVDQNVVVTGQNDADVVDNDGMLTFSATGLNDTTVSVHVTDDDVLGILPSTTTLGTLNEGGSTTFTVRLTQQPPSNVVVAISTSDSMVLTATPTPLTFTTTTWMTPQMVTVNLPEDIDTADESATVTLMATGLPTRTISAMVDDNDTQTVIATPDPAPVDENGSRVLSVRLQYQPSADVVLSVTSLNTAVATVSTSSLTFTPGNYDQSQVVTINAPDDLDAVPNMTTVRLQSLPNALTRDVTVNVTDDDQLLIETSVTSVAFAENGNAMFGVRLTAMPGATVTVSLASSDPTVASVSPSMLTFTTSTYGTYQMVTVSGVADQDLTAETPTITLSAAGLQQRMVDVSVTDDDVQRVLVTSSTVPVNEGATTTVGVSLEFIPTSATTVNIASMDPNVATVSPATRTFMPGDYSTPQNVTITGVSDADALDESTTITASVAGMTTNVTVNVNDDDALAIESSVTTTTVGEAGTQTFGVRLTAQPAANTVVSVTSSDATGATVSPSSLTFTTSDWNTFKQVTVTGIGDPDAVNDIVDVTLASAPLADRTVRVTVTDDDQQDILLTTGTLSVGEAGSNTFGVRLAAMPTSDVMVSVSSANSNEATASPSTLTFTPLDYATNKTVTVNGVADLDLTNDGVNINLSLAGVNRSVAVTVNDDDMQTVIASNAGPLNLTEGGATTQVLYSLQFIPTGPTTVTVTPPAGVAVNPTTLSFTTGNYSTAQPVTVSAPEDADAADVTLGVITASAPMATSATTTVNVDDNDVLGLSVSVSTLMVPEGGSASFQVQLTAQPASNVVVMVQSTDTNVAAVTPAQAMLTFTPGTWNVPQSPQINGVQDVDVQSEGANITLTSSVGSANVGVTVVDDDVVSIETTVGAVNVNEAGTATFGVHLSHQPSSAITVSVASANTAVMQIASGATLVFDSTNYATNQNVTVTGVNDADFANATADANVTASGLANRTVTVNVLDDDFTLTDISDQMGPDAGSEFMYTFGTGYASPMTGTMNGNALTSLQYDSATQIGFRNPARTSSGKWSDFRMTKAGNTQTIPRAFHYGAWEDSSSGMNGGYVSDVVSYVSTTDLYATAENALFKSTNGGTTWTRMDISAMGSVYRMAQNPNNAQVLYLTTPNGLFVTTNGGTSYTELGDFQNVTCVGTNPAQSTHLYACDGTTLYRSVDSGANWTNVATIPSNTYLAPSWNGSTAYLATRSGVLRTSDNGVMWGNASGNLGTVGVDVVAVSPANPQIALAGVLNQGIYRTTDGGGQWTLSTTGPNSAIDFAFNPAGATAYAATYAGVYKSTDGGVTWNAANSGLPAKAQSLRAMSLRSTQEVYIGSDSYGVWKTTNGGQSWTRSDTGIQATTPSTIAAHPATTGMVFAVTNGGLYKSTNSGATWTLSESGLPVDSGVYAIAITHSSPYIMFVSAGTGLYRSTDSGATWTPTSITSGSPQSIGFDPANPQHVYAFLSSGGTVVRSIDSGMTFQPFTTSGLPPQPNIGAFVRSGSSMLVFEYNSNSAYRFDGSASTWVAGGMGIPSPLIALFDGPGNQIYAANFSNLYRSTDGGATFSLYLSGYSNILWDPNRAQTAFLWRSYNGPERTLSSTTYRASFNDGIPNGQFRGHFAIDSNGTTVYTTVYSRGVYRITD